MSPARLLRLALALLWVASSLALAQNSPPVEQIGFDQHLGLLLPLQTPFQDEAGHMHPLNAYIGQRPVLLVMAYYSCSDLCDLMINSAAQALRKSRLQAGRDLDVVVVSINPTETAPMAAAKKQAFLDPAAPGYTGWHFLTGSANAIALLTQAVGFRYHYDAQTGQYAHAAGLTLVTPDGRISRYVLGLDYQPHVFADGISQAAHGQIGGLSHQLLLLCYHYDPVSGRYTPLVMRWVRAIACGIALLLGIYTLRQLRRGRRPGSEAVS
jgi:protein SCO1/2